MRLRASFIIYIPIIILLVALLPKISMAISDSSVVMTDSGIRVIAYPDGNWEYLDVLEGPGHKTHTKPENAIKASMSRTGAYELWYDPAKWKDVKNEAGKDELTLVHSHGLVSAKGLAMPTGADSSVAAGIALRLIKASYPDTEVLEAEKLIVNDVEVTRMLVAGTKGPSDRTILYGYCRKGKDSYVQVMTMSAEDAFKDLKTDIDELLNGLVIRMP